MEKQILEILENEEIAELENSHSILIIRFREFFGNKKEFHFELNSKAIDNCKTKRTALKKIKRFINQGFQLI